MDKEPMHDPAVLLVEGSDFDTFPVGGQLTMVRSLMKLFGGQLALVGMDRGGGPTGQWIRKEICGDPYMFFPLCRREPSAKKPLIPLRLSVYSALRRFRERILSLGCRAVFTQAPEALMAMSGWEWDSFCFWFAGVESPLKVSRYAFARPLCSQFDRLTFSALRRVDVILAAADDNAITALVSRSRGRLSRDSIIQVPTCVDTSQFHPTSIEKARNELGIPKHSDVFVNSGRIGRFKGWPFLLDSFEILLNRCRDALLYFVGDGEERPLLQAQIEERHLGRQVRVTGFQAPDRVMSYLNAADAAVFGSFVEGWSAAMLEALACGKPIVSTRVSGVGSMIAPGRNGFVIESRNPVEFAKAMEDSLRLSGAESVSISMADKFGLPTLRERLTSSWEPFSRCSEESASLKSWRH